MDGIGKLEYEDGSCFSGQFRCSRREGKGTINFLNGDVFTCNFHDDYPHGLGIYKMSDGRESKGLWDKGQLYSDTVLYRYSHNFFFRCPNCVTISV